MVADRTASCREDCRITERLHDGVVFIECGDLDVALFGVMMVGMVRPYGTEAFDLRGQP